MLQIITTQYPRNKWIKQCKNNGIDLWALMDFIGETPLISPSIPKVPENNYCRLCGTKFSIRSAQQKFYLQKECTCGDDGIKKATITKLSVFVTPNEAEQYILESNRRRCSGLPNSIEYWVQKGETVDSARLKLVEVQTARSAKSPASRPGARGFSVRTKEYWTNKGFTEEEASVKISELQVTNGLDWYVKRYGEQLGKEKFDARIAQWLNSSGNRNMVRGRSSKALELFDLLPKAGAYGENEKVVRGKLRSHRVDYILGNKIVEFNGDYWHANPMNCPTGEEMIRKKKAKDIWEHDSDKINDLLLAGFEVLVVWENDYITNTTEVITKCKDFLSEY